MIHCPNIIVYWRKKQVAWGEAGQDGEAAGGGQVEDGRGAKKVFDAPRNQSWCIFFRLEEEKLALEKERLRVYFSSNSSRADSGDCSSSVNVER